MALGGYKIRNRTGLHFVTFAVVEWVDVFTREDYRKLFLTSLAYCQEHKGLELYSWCLMSNHVHMILRTVDGDLSSVLRDFKKFTAKALIQAISSNPEESRRTWMLSIFKQAGSQNSRNAAYQFWQQDNHPEELFSTAFTQQKLDYIHNNPVAAGLVGEASYYLYSSARDYEEGRHVGFLKVEFLS
ncbi:MAG: transposase [Bacteroidota bacterium]